MSKDYNAFERYGTAKKGTGSYSYAPTEIEVLQARKAARILLWGAAGSAVAGLYAFFVFAPAMFFTIIPVVLACVVGASVVYGIIRLIALIINICGTFVDARNYGVAEDE